MIELIQQWVSFQAKQRPDATALVMGEETATYASLEASSNQLARILREVGCKRGDRVALLVNKSPRAIAAILGVLKADCIYVPLDTSSPAPRLQLMLAACEPRWVIASCQYHNLLSALLKEGTFEKRVGVGWLDASRQEKSDFTLEFTLDDVQKYSAEPPETQNTRDNLAYILFTSGSTGVPKGVGITHSNVIHFIEWATSYFGINSSDRLSGHSPLCFDLSVFDIFGTLAAGAQLRLVSPELNLLPHKLAEFIQASALSQWFSVPSVLTYMAKFDVLATNEMTALKRIIWCGEVLPTPVLIYLMNRLPGASFTNLYGPTEATVASSYYTVPACPVYPTAEIPIGTACKGEELLVLDNELHPAPPGVVGDLYIGGVGLSPGYWRDPEKTRTAFIPHPYSSDTCDRIYKTGDLAQIKSDGLVYFNGRADFQIKSRGYRIELGEVEAALNALPSLAACAVVAVDSDEGQTPCAAYVPTVGSVVTPAILKEELRKALPNYMVPSRWMKYDTLPCNSNGKVDRPRLRKEFEYYAVSRSQN